MKQFHKIKGYALAVLMITGFFLGMTGCNESDPPMVSVSKEIIRVNAESQSIPVTVISNVDWTASCDASWVKLSKKSGKGTVNIDVVIEDYSETYERSSVININAKGSNTSIRVLQSAINSILMVAPSGITVGCKGETVSFAVASNTEWTVASSKDWASPSVAKQKGNAIVNVKISENESHDSDREAVITVTAGSGDGERIVETFTVKQLSRALPSLVLSQSAITFTAKAKSEGSNTAVIQSITNITGEIKASCDFSWCNASYANGKLTVSVEDNNGNISRQCLISVVANVAGEAVIKQITVYQAGLGSPDVQLVKNSVILDAHSGNLDTPEQNVSIAFIPENKMIGVTVVKDYPQWISEVTIKDNILKFKVARNYLPESRNAIITLAATLASETLLYPVSVTQMGEQQMKMSLSREYANFTFKADTTEIGVFCNVAGSEIEAYIADAKWCNVEVKTNSVQHEHSAIITIVASENMGYALRKANIVVIAKAADQRVYKNITVSQAGVGTPNIKAIESAIVLRKERISQNDSAIVHIIGADDKTSLKAVSSENWLKPAVFENKKMLFLSAEANPYSASREALLTIIAEKGGEIQLVNINITQLGSGSASLIFERQEYTYSHEGGKVYFIPIMTLNDTKYSIVSFPSWMSVFKNPIDYVFGLAVKPEENNSVTPRTGKIVLLAQNGDSQIYYTINITQNGVGSPEIYPVAKNVVIPQKGAHFFTIQESDYSVRIIGADLDKYTSVETTDEVSWLETQISSDRKRIYISAQDNNAVNKREAVVTIIALRGGETVISHFTVTQLGTGSAGLVFPVQEYDIPADGYDDFNIRFIRINGSKYGVTQYPEWISMVSSDDGDPIVIDVEKNVMNNSRSGEIVLRVSNGDETIYQSIVINQLGIGSPNIIPVTNSVVFDNNAVITGNTDKFVVLTGIQDAQTTFMTPVSTEGWVSAIVTGDRITFSVNSDNTAVNKRQATVTLVAQRGGKYQSIIFTITQRGTGSAGLKYDYNTVYFGPTNPETYYLPVIKLNGSTYSVVTHSSWINATVDENTLNITVDNNTASVKRFGGITLLATNGEDRILYTVSVVQNGVGTPAANTLFNSMILPYQECTLLSIDTYNYKIRIFDLKPTDIVSTSVHGGNDWLQSSIMEGSGNTYITFEAEENFLISDRSALVAVTVSDGDAKVILYFNVTQRGKGSPSLLFPIGQDLSFGPSAIDHQYIPITNGENTSIEIINSSSLPAWLVVNEIITAGNTRGIDLKFSNNTSTQPRRFVLILKAYSLDDPSIFIEGGVSFYQLSITQNGLPGPNVQALSNEIIFDSSGGAKDMSIINYDGITMSTAYISGDWVQTPVFDPATGKISFVVNQNSGAQSREATCIMRAVKNGEEQYINFKIKQKGQNSPNVVAAITEFNVTGNGTVQTPLLNIKGNITITTSSDWITATTSGVDVQLLNIAYTANTLGYARTGFVTVIAQNTISGEQASAVVKLIQSPAPSPEVIFASTSIVFGSEQFGVDKIIPFVLRNFDNSVTATVTTSDSWIIANIDMTQNRLTVSVNENTTLQTRSGNIYVKFSHHGVDKMYTLAVTHLTKAQSHEIVVYTPDNGIWDSENLKLTVDKNITYSNLSIPIKSNCKLKSIASYATYDGGIQKNYTKGADATHYNRANKNYNGYDFSVPFDQIYISNEANNQYSISGELVYDNVHDNDSGTDLTNVSALFAPCRYGWIAFNWRAGIGNNNSVVCNADFVYPNTVNNQELTAGERTINLVIWAKQPAVERTGYVVIDDGEGTVKTITVIQK